MISNLYIYKDKCVFDPIYVLVHGGELKEIKCKCKIRIYIYLYVFYKNIRIYKLEK